MPRFKMTEIVDLDLPLAAAWSVATDTARINLEVGNAAYTVVEEEQADGTILRRGTGKVGPISMQWLERFGQWVDLREFSQERLFSSGPFRRIVFAARLSPSGPDTTRLQVDGQVDWQGPFGALLAHGGFLRRLLTDRTDLIRRLAVAKAAAGTEPLAALRPPALSTEAAARLAATLSDLRERHAPELVAQAENLLRQAPETDLYRLRPLALAAAWAQPEDAVIAFCLDAHRQGLLSLRWEILCPRCRGGKGVVGNLYELPRGVHCPSCNIDYERAFSSNVELVFRPEPWLRPVADGAYCLLGPVTSPHVKVQHHLEPGETAILDAELPAGAYRLRTLEPGPEVELDWDGEGGFPELVIGPDDVRAGPAAPAGQMVLRNLGPHPRHAVIEARDWVADALTGDRVIQMPAFRELCPEQVIRPGDEVGIARACVMFADLKGSTALYARIGDAAAYGLVRDYFAFFAEHLRASGGILVKTMGDAVMAAFTDPAMAVSMALAIHRDLADFERDHGAGAVAAKIGIHAGPCVAVNTGGLLDYFGRTVNLAARLQAQSDGSDIVLSRELAEDPAIAALLAGLPTADADVQLRGMPAPTPLRRVWPQQAPAEPS